MSVSQYHFSKYVCVSFERCLCLSSTSTNSFWRSARRVLKIYLALSANDIILQFPRKRNDFVRTSNTMRSDLHLLDMLNEICQRIAIYLPEDFDESFVVQWFGIRLMFLSMWKSSRTKLSAINGIMRWFSFNFYSIYLSKRTDNIVLCSE